MCLQQSFIDLSSMNAEGQTSVLSRCSILWQLWVSHLVQQVWKEQLLILWQTPRQPSQWLLSKGGLEGEEGDWLLWHKVVLPNSTYCQSCFLSFLGISKTNKLDILSSYPVSLPDVSHICFFHRRSSVVLAFHLEVAKFTSWHLLLADSSAAEQVDSPYFSFPLNESDVPVTAEQCLWKGWKNSVATHRWEPLTT